MEQSLIQSANGISLQGTLAPGVSLTTQPGEFTIGDPPYGQPYPGTTWIPGGWPIGTAAPWPGYPNPYIGDPPPGYEPPIKITPVPQQVWPTVVPNGLNPYLGPSTFTMLPNPWNVQFLADHVIARCDVPGAILDSLNVEITNGSIQVSYRRFDTNGLCYPQAQFIGADYDPKTAEATLEQGVLTIIVKPFAAKLSHKVPVTAK